ncbi:ATP-dependent nuclease [Ralstonia solanacearum]|uniref:ATP-dependent nuclease n=1 Tax=Ralstonia solanacearum TaxID=305 RepID=UPI001313DB7B|nr:AAA family ATPase [Ralstonia solanacearum]
MGEQTLQVDGDISIVIGPNGGGKSNLLETTLLLLRRHIFTSWFVDAPVHSMGTLRHPLKANDIDLRPQLQKHSDGGSRPQVASIELEVTEQDVANITGIIRDRERIAAAVQEKYLGASLPNFDDWNNAIPMARERVRVDIQSDSVQPQGDPANQTYISYLQNFEWISRIKSEIDVAALPTPMLLLPANRAAHGLGFDVGMAGFQERDHKKQVDVSNSRMPAQITQLAVGRLASRYLDLLHTEEGGATDKFMATPEAQGLTRSLEALGYGWSLRCIDRRSNNFTVELRKAGRTFPINDASSGEKEILLYLFAIFGLSVREAVVIVDEPELHLHPRLQRTLYRLFDDLAETTGNQFILATHSPVFVSPSSIRHVSRVYSDAGSSKIVRLNDANLPNAKHLFNIVNSQNNEVLFFADRVLLVEGLSDRIFFERLLQRFISERELRSTFEVIAVGGKGLFDAYAKVLAACKVPFSILADQDYLQQVGSEEVKRLLRLDAEGVKKGVIEDPTSRDAESLVAQIDEAIRSGSWGDASATWEYIKSRRRRLNANLSDDEWKQVNACIADLRGRGIYVLSKGPLEAYLPVGYRSKDIEKLITFLEVPDFWSTLPDAARDELSTIFSHLLTDGLPQASERDIVPESSTESLSAP